MRYSVRVRRTHRGDPMAQIMEAHPVVEETCFLRLRRIAIDILRVIHQLNGVEIPTPKRGIFGPRQKGRVSEARFAGDTVVIDECHIASAPSRVVQTNHLGPPVPQHLEDLVDIQSIPTWDTPSSIDVEPWLHGKHVDVLWQSAGDLLPDDGIDETLQVGLGNCPRPIGDNLVVGGHCDFQPLPGNRHQAVGHGNVGVRARCRVEVGIHGEITCSIQQLLQGHFHLSNLARLHLDALEVGGVFIATGDAQFKSARDGISGALLVAGPESALEGTVLAQFELSRDRASRFVHDQIGQLPARRDRECHCLQARRVHRHGWSGGPSRYVEDEDKGHFRTEVSQPPGKHSLFVSDERIEGL